MSEYEKECYTCKYLKVDEHEDPCMQCFAFDAWEPMEKDAEKTVKEWERRIFDRKVPNVDCEYQIYKINKKKLSCDTCIYYGTSSCTNKRKREEALKKTGGDI